jgi:hypothetical protein
LAISYKTPCRNYCAFFVGLPFEEAERRVLLNSLHAEDGRLGLIGHEGNRRDRSVFVEIRQRLKDSEGMFPGRVHVPSVVRLKPIEEVHETRAFTPVHGWRVHDPFLLTEADRELRSPAPFTGVAHSPHQLIERRAQAMDRVSEDDSPFLGGMRDHIYDGEEVLRALRVCFSRKDGYLGLAFKPPLDRIIQAVHVFRHRLELEPSPANRVVHERTSA